MMYTSQGQCASCPQKWDHTTSDKQGFTSLAAAHRPSWRVICSWFTWLIMLLFSGWRHMARECIWQLDSVCWFSHWHSHARKDCSRQNHTQAAVKVHCHHPFTPWRPHNGLVYCCMQCTALPCILSGEDSAFFVFFVPVTFIFDLDIRIWARFLYNTPNCQVSSSYV